MIKQMKDARIYWTKKKKAIRENNNTTWRNKPESTGERRNIKEISIKGKRIQIKQDIPKQRKKILLTTGRRWHENIPTIECKSYDFGLKYGNQKQNKKAECINNITRELERLKESLKAEIHIDLLKTTQKISNWKTPGHEEIHGFWFRKFTSIHDTIALKMNRCLQGAHVKRYPLTPPTLSQSSNHSTSYADRWSTSGWGGNAHFFTYTRIRSRETGENRKTNEQTKLGVNQEQRKVCNTTCMCIPDSRYGLTLAWVTSENSTMLLESDILRLFFTGPYLVSSPLCSGVWCWLPLRSSTPTSAVRLSPVQPQLPSAACLSALQPPTASLGLLPPTPLSGSRRQLSFSGPATNSHSRVQPPTLLSPVQLPTLSSLLSSHQPSLSLARVVNSHSPPRTTSGYGEISCPRILCLVSRQNRQLNRLLWQPTPIVLHIPSLTLVIYSQ